MPVSDWTKRSSEKGKDQETGNPQSPLATSKTSRIVNDRKGTRASTKSDVQDTKFI
jgi:hypothetical protein